MNVTDLIVVILGFLTILFMSLKRRYDVAQRRKYPERYRKQEEKERAAFRKLLESLDLPIPEELQHEEVELEPEKIKVEPAIVSSPSTVKTAPRRTVRSGFQFHSKIEDRKMKSRIASRHIPTKIELKDQNRFDKAIVSPSISSDTLASAYLFEERKTDAPVVNILKRLRSRQDMVVLRELLGPPKGMTGFPDEGH